MLAALCCAASPAIFLCKMAALLFCHDLLNDSNFESLFSMYLLQTGILGFQLSHSGHQRCIHTCFLGALFVECGRADTMFSACFRHRCSNFGLFQDSNDLAICKPWLFHVKSSVYRLQENSTLGLHLFKDGLLTDTWIFEHPLVAEGVGTDTVFSDVFLCQLG